MIESKLPVVYVKRNELINLILTLFIFLIVVFPDYIGIFIYTKYGIFGKLQMIVCIAMLISIFINIKFIRHDSIFSLVIIYIFFAIQYFLMNMNNEKIHILDFFTNCIFFLYMDIQFKKNCNRQIKSIFIVLFLYVFINLITVIVFRNGLYLSSVTHNPSYILGHRNSITKFAIPMIFFSVMFLITSNKKNYKIKEAFFILINLIAAVMVWTGSGLISLVIMICVYYFVNIGKFRNLNSIHLYIIGISLFVLLSVFRMQDMFSFIIEGMLHKDMTLTGRTELWDLALYGISNNIITGVGSISDFYDSINMSGFSSFHSFYLDLLYRGGLILFIAFFTMAILLTKNIKTIRNNKTRAIIASTILAYLIIGLVEPIGGVVIRLFILVLQSTYWTVKKEENRNENKYKSKFYL